MPALTEALARLYDRIPLGMRLGLDPMRRACAALGHPESAVATVHVAGTNGKGSACAMVASIARAHGLRTGLYTSPHLCCFAERIQMDGEPIDDETLAHCLTRALDAGRDLSFFETATLAAFVAFREARVDVAVIEVGIGGRFDATNVIPSPRAAAITRIALDHTDRLGPTLVDIAREKAGIAKPGLDLVLGPMPDELRQVIDAVAHARGATTSSVDHVPIPASIGLAGEHQKDNARVAAALAARIGATASAIARGIANVRWPGRLETLGRYLLDAAHNPDGSEALAAYLRRLAHPPSEVALVFGTLADKDWRRMLDVLAPCAEHRIYVAARGGARAAVDPQMMAQRCPGLVATGAEEALAIAHGDRAGWRSQPKLVVVAGSIILVGQVRAQLLGLPVDAPVAL